MNDVEQRKAAKEFAAYWQGKGYEKGQSQPFWLSLLNKVYGVENPEQFISFENQVHLDHTSFIDGYISETKVMIEQKSIKKDLLAPIKQSDGTLLKPIEQAKRYAAELPVSQHPKWIVTCNFEKFLVYDMEHPHNEPEEILLSNLPEEYYRLNFLVDNGSAHIRKEMEVSMAAGELVGKLYNAFLNQYNDPSNAESLRSLNKLCVRLVFCLYAEDAGIFGEHDMFHDYLERFEVRDLRRALIDLFKVLDQKPAKRDPYLDKQLAAFPYVNGGLFEDENIEIPNCTEEIRDLLLQKASSDFDWSKISPTIFGAVFESTLNPETRRSGGMHYTSIENIHKVIDPLFLDELKNEFTKIKNITVKRTRKLQLEAFQKKLAGLKFLDPACGSGNFLTETYISLRKIENEVIRLLTGGEMILGELLNPIQVQIKQFYGIEINDFAVAVAKTALWIAESQMMKATEDIVHMSLDFLPLKTYTNIHEGNALSMDWEDVVPKNELNYIMGNPPFVGARMMSAAQKNELLKIFDGLKNAGNLDYVSCWYKKATEMMHHSKIRTALVSTNSITQGEQVAILWKPLFEEGVHIDFAYRTFRWDSEASNRANVHCVIIGFSISNNLAEKIIFTGNQRQSVKHINAYLLDGDDIFVKNRKTVLCKPAPEARSGNKPIDDGNYLFLPEEMEEFIKKEPLAKNFFRPWIGAYEFINRKPRYCLWLGDCSPSELRRMPLCLKRVEAVKEFRLNSKSPGTRKLADKPTRFHVETIPTKPFLVMPLTSSERRKYVPIGFLPPNYLASNLVVVVANASLYDFGVITSNVFMAWMRYVCGRLKSDYRITKDNVYNNFPWPTPTEAQKAKIAQTAQGILDARALYPDSSLADLYDDSAMPFKLLKAHRANDKAVMEAYGFYGKGMTESQCVAELMKMYQVLANN